MSPPAYRVHRNQILVKYCMKSLLWFTRDFEIRQAEFYTFFRANNKFEEEGTLILPFEVPVKLIAHKNPVFARSY